MLTLKEFNKYPNGSIFRMGLISNSPTGCFMTRDENIPLLNFVAKKGDIGDWTVYFGKPNMHNITGDSSIQQVDFFSLAMTIDTGDKTSNTDWIRNAVPCDDDVFKLYRK